MPEDKGRVSPARQVLDYKDDAAGRGTDIQKQTVSYPRPPGHQLDLMDLLEWEPDLQVPRRILGARVRCVQPPELRGRHARLHTGFMGGARLAELLEASEVAGWSGVGEAVGDVLERARVPALQKAVAVIILDVDLQKPRA